MRNNSLWADAIRRLMRDRFVCAMFAIVFFYFLVALLAKLGILAGDWDTTVGPAYAPPSSEHWLGTDIFGRDVLRKVIQGTRTAIAVGLVSSAIAIPLGVFFGAIAGYFGGIVDDFVVWLYSTLSSIPSILLIISLAYVLGRGIISVYIAIGVTTWVGLCRLMRAEFMKHKEREYVLASKSIGSGHFRRIFRHILPNVFHIVIISFSLRFVYAIKTEVILSYLNLGAQKIPSWGRMISDAKQELFRGVWWQLAGATVAMFFVVLAFNIVGDALRDAIDPQLRGTDFES